MRKIMAQHSKLESIANIGSIILDIYLAGIHYRLHHFGYLAGIHPRICFGGPVSKAFGPARGVPRPPRGSQGLRVSQQPRLPATLESRSRTHIDMYIYIYIYIYLYKTSMYTTHIHMYVCSYNCYTHICVFVYTYTTHAYT